jgi:hypothetical protein
MVMQNAQSISPTVADDYMLLEKEEGREGGVRRTEHLESLPYGLFVLDVSPGIGVITVLYTLQILVFGPQ